MHLIFGELRPRLLNRALEDFQLTSTKFAYARALLALAQLSVIVVTPYSALMQTVLGVHDAPSCAGIRAASIYCLGQGAPPWIPTVAMAAVLVTVVVGILPPIGAFLHAWVAFSIATSIALPDGGDQAAAVFTLLLIAVSLGDNRPWIGSRACRPLPHWRRQVALAGLMAMRAQVALLYFTSGISKLSTRTWANGTEEFYVARDSYFGASGLVGSTLASATQSAFITVSMTWGSSLLEVALATLILCGSTARRVALCLALLLHGVIILTIGLWSFGLIMIAVVAIASVTPTGRHRITEGTFRCRKKNLFPVPEAGDRLRTPP